MAEQMLGRPLRPDEDVHHRDGDRTNNDPANLEVLGHGEHRRRHNRMKAGTSHTRALMPCPACGRRTYVALVRQEAGRRKHAIRRVRECRGCGLRFDTTEKAALPLLRRWRGGRKER